jgi:ATP-dependent helicase/nuclease subunit A
VIDRILGRRHYLVKLTGTAHEAQAHANLEKLQRMARSHDLRGFVTLYDFTRRLRRLIDEEEGEGQGVIESQRDAVRIMTVHAAKGLEFPVVVLPHLHRAIRSDREPFIDEKLGLAFTYLEDGGEALAPPFAQFLKTSSRGRTEAEEKRIFYVACTRAREMLILSGEEHSSRGGRSWMEWLRQALHWEPPLSAGALTFHCRTATLEFDGERYRRGEHEHDLVLPVLRGTLDLPGPSPEAPPVVEAVVPLLRARPLPARAKGEIYSATRIRTYLECPAKYYLRYVMGLPDEGRAIAGLRSEETDDADFPGEARGRVFHAVMQRIDALPPGREHLAGEAERALSTERRMDESTARQFINEVVEAVEQVLASPFWREAAGAGEVRTEFTISSVLGEDYISGTMDRVYRDAGGAWHVLDYKTDRVDADTVAGRAEGYWPQLAFYALLVHRFFSAPQVTATLLFTSLPLNPLRRRFDAAELAAVEARIREAVSRIKGGDFRPSRVPCHGCPLAPQGCAFLGDQGSPSSRSHV